MLYPFKEYLKYLKKATNQHGVHSPFVYDLVTKCFYKKINITPVSLFLNYKKELLKEHRIIKVKDFGSGSKVFKTSERKISKIAKVAGISTKKAKFLMRFINYFSPENILELGTSLGLSTTAIYLGNPQSSITTLEGCPETMKIAQEYFKKSNIKISNCVVGAFENTLKKNIENKNFDFIYFDGNHQKKATLNYFNSCLSTIHNNSIFIFDDIHWNKEMTEAWHIIKEHPKVTVTIDIFHLGIVFFRKEQAKEHFTIRI